MDKYEYRPGQKELPRYGPKSYGLHDPLLELFLHPARWNSGEEALECGSFRHWYYPADPYWFSLELPFKDPAFDQLIDSYSNRKALKHLLIQAARYLSVNTTKDKTYYQVLNREIEDIEKLAKESSTLTLKGLIKHLESFFNPIRREIEYKSKTLLKEGRDRSQQEEQTLAIISLIAEDNAIPVNVINEIATRALHHSSADPLINIVAVDKKRRRALFKYKEEISNWLRTK